MRRQVPFQWNSALTSPAAMWLAASRCPRGLQPSFTGLFGGSSSASTTSTAATTTQLPMVKLDASVRLRTVTYDIQRFNLANLSGTVKDVQVCPSRG